MAKAKTKPIQTTVDAPTVNAVVEDFNSNGHAPDLRLIDLDNLYKSHTNPRKRFPEASIEELAISIREKGILEPLIVRVKTDLSHNNPAFEIVCGERRYRAASRAGLTHAPCLVRELTDDEVLDIQIHENLHREDVHPMDEAYGYKFLQEKLRCDITELALRVGKSESYVLNRLKLNQLIPEIQKDIEDGYLTLSMGLEIAKYAPESQQEIYLEIYDDVEYDHDLERHVLAPNADKTFKNLDTPVAINKWASDHILHLLAKAPFDTKATNLRADGLACVNCPDRTGANASLFEGQIGKKDSCLDTACWNRKKKAHLDRVREHVAHKATLDVDQVPLVTTVYSSREPGILNKHNYIRIGTKKDSWESTKSTEKCDKSSPAVCVDDSEFGKIFEVCLPSSGCKEHYPTAKAAATAQAAIGTTSTGSKVVDEKELDKKRQRREEIFDMRVSDIVRKRIFRLAAEKFAGEFEMSDNIPNFFADLLTKLWLSTSGGGGPDQHTLIQVVTGIMQQITDEKGFNWTTYRGWSDDKPDSETESGRAIAKLSERNKKLMLFLFVHGNKGNTYSDRWSSQKEVRQLAEQYNIDYTLLDAQVRVEVAQEKAKKHLPLYKEYLTNVESGNAKAKIPRPYSSNWKPK